jgi:flagellin-specific chaperone FliS
MVFNTTFNNSSVISRQSVLLVEESGENNLSEFTDKLYHIMLYKLFKNNPKKLPQIVDTIPLKVYMEYT